MYHNEHIYATKEEIEKLIIESKKILNDFDQIENSSDYFKELSNLALLQLEAGYYKESENNLQQSLKYFENLHDKLGSASVYGILATLYFNKEDYKTSIEYYEFALNIYKELNQISEEIVCLKGIALNLLKLNKLDESCEKFLECSSICSDQNDLYNLLDCLGNLIYIYEGKEEWDLVFDLYKKSLEAFIKLKDTKGIITSYFNLGILKKRNREYDESIKYFKLGTNSAIEANYIESILKGLGYIGEILVYQAKLKEAKEKYIKALHIASKMKAKNSILQLNILLRSLGLTDMEIEEQLNQYKKKYNNTN